MVARWNVNWCDAKTANSLKDDQYITTAYVMFIAMAQVSLRLQVKHIIAPGQRGKKNEDVLS